jgi:putative glutamine amidotransferase
VHEQPDRRHHHPDEALPIAEQYGPMHTVQFASGGLLERVTGTSGASVNSLHYQGVDRLANGLAVEARADDGLVEAFRVENASAFALAVQWHPEWRVMENPVSLAIFRAFGEACRERARES